MTYRIMNRDGKEVAGTQDLDDVAKAAAMLESGWIENDAGEMVYESPTYAAEREKAAEFEQIQADAQAVADYEPPVPPEPESDEL